MYKGKSVCISVHLVAVVSAKDLSGREFALKLKQTPPTVICMSLEGAFSSVVHKNCLLFYIETLLINLGCYHSLEPWWERINFLVA